MENLSQKVFNDRYALKDTEGNQVEQTFEEMWRRIAKGAASVEKPENHSLWEERFYNTLKDFKFVPGGRILSGIGNKTGVTFYNCFVLPSPTDSRGGIMDSVKLMTEIMSRGGGAGVNISTLRPRGSYVKGVHGTASGSVSFGGLYSFATGLITQGGSRRGALMLVLDISHPDIEEFITAKQTPGVLTNANLSVAISDDFIEVLKRDGDWELKWNGEVQKTVKASYLWNLICESAWASGEPGIVFLDRGNKLSNTWYHDKLISTNPCVTGDTLVYTKKGLKKIENLCEEKGVSIVLDKRISRNKFAKINSAFKTGTKNTYRLETKEGYEIKLTIDHRVKTSGGFISASKLKKGDKILVLSHKGGFGREGSLEIGRLIGWFVGDGHFNVSQKRAVLSFFGEEKKELSPLFISLVNNILNDKSLLTHNYRYYKSLTIQQVNSRDEDRIASKNLWAILHSYGLQPGNKLCVPKAVYEGSEDMQCGFLQALFTADGHVSGKLEKGFSVRLTSVSYSFLQEVQQILLNFGIFSKIYKNRRKEGYREMPDSKRKLKAYYCNAQHDLVISKDCLKIFAQEIGFLVSRKQEKLDGAIKSFSKGPYRTEFVATFEGLKHVGKEEVFDLTEPLTHSFVANGFVIHNCGEQPLPAWGVCNLGSINLSSFEKDGSVDIENLGSTVRDAVRFLDNIIDLSHYHFEENKQAQMSVRRVGLGTMGLADLLIKLKIRYGSEESLQLMEDIYKFIRNEAYATSVVLAKEKGSFPAFDRERYLQGKFIQTLPGFLKDVVGQYGIRNATLLTQAPTGTTSILANTSSGIEPIYDFKYTRKDRLGEHIIFHPLYKKHIDEHGEDNLPGHFVTAKQLSPTEHIKMQAMIQKHIDSSISKTVNAPNSHTVEDVKNLYTLAHELGCKGVTYFREGSRDDSVLTSIGGSGKDGDKKEKGKEKDLCVDSSLFGQLKPKERPRIMKGETYKVPMGYGKMYVTVNTDENNMLFEVFARIGKTGGFFEAKAEAICRLVSLALRSGINVKDVISQLKGIRGPMPSWGEKGMILSIPDGIAQTLEEHINRAQQKLDLSFKEDVKTSDALKTDVQKSDVPKEHTKTSDVPRTSDFDTKSSDVDTTRKGELEKLREDSIMGMNIPEVQAQKMGPDDMKEMFYQKDSYVKFADNGEVPECPSCGGLLEYAEGCLLCRSCGYSKCT